MNIHNTTGAGDACAASTAKAGPWWRYGLVWMVIAGPAAVVLASIVTVFIALSHPEVVIAEDYYRHGLEIDKKLEAEQRSKALMPAMQGRNHAATPAPGAQ